MKRELWGKEFWSDQWLAACFLRNGWSIVRSASLAKGGALKKRPSLHLHKVLTLSNKASPQTLQTAFVHWVMTVEHVHCLVHLDIILTENGCLDYAPPTYSESIVERCFCYWQSYHSLWVNMEIAWLSKPSVSYCINTWCHDLEDLNRNLSLSSTSKKFLCTKSVN
jgi:hypothetical protein